MNKIIVQSARLHCHIQSAFEMFTHNDYLEAWLTTIADVEPVVGGKYELFWDPTDRTRSCTLGCKVTAIEPDTLLAFEWKGPPQFNYFMNNVDPLTHVTVFFRPCEEVLTPCTDIYLVHTGWRDTEDWEEARQFFVRAWERAFADLESLING